MAKENIPRFEKVSRTTRSHEKSSVPLCLWPSPVSSSVLSFRPDALSLSFHVPTASRLKRADTSWPLTQHVNDSCLLPPPPPSIVSDPDLLLMPRGGGGGGRSWGKKCTQGQDLGRGKTSVVLEATADLQGYLTLSFWTLSSSQRGFYFWLPVHELLFSFSCTRQPGTLCLVAVSRGCLSPQCGVSQKANKPQAAVVVLNHLNVLTL